MPIHRVPGTPCYIEYSVEPDDDYVKRFTELKLADWPEVQGPIDAYIGIKTMDHINAASSARRRKRAKHTHVYAARLQKVIDTEINRGLAIIAFNDRVDIKFGSGLTIVNKQFFEQSIGRLIKSMHGAVIDDLSYKKRQSRYWADSCAFEISQAFFGRRLPR